MKTLKISGVFLLVVSGIALMLVPAVREAREATRRIQCSGRLTQLVLALHSYHRSYNVFPPACTVDKNGNPLHSWRTLILPFVDEQKLYDSIDLSKPWNDPVNAVANTTVIDVYRCPATDLEATRTTYMAVVTPESVIRQHQSCRFEDINDGTSNTLLLVEVSSEKAVPWMAPVDAEEPMLQIRGIAKSTSHLGRRHGALVDGSVRDFSDSMPYKQNHALVTVNGGEAVGDF